MHEDISILASDEAFVFTDHNSIELAKVAEDTLQKYHIRLYGSVRRPYSSGDGGLPPALNH